jgi:hypothetical protein
VARLGAALLCTQLPQQPQYEVRRLRVVCSRGATGAEGSW